MTFPRRARRQDSDLPTDKRTLGATSPPFPSQPAPLCSAPGKSLHFCPAWIPALGMEDGNTHANGPAHGIHSAAAQALLAGNNLAASTPAATARVRSHGLSPQSCWHPRTRVASRSLSSLRTELLKYHSHAQELHRSKGTFAFSHAHNTWK